MSKSKDYGTPFFFFFSYCPESEGRKGRQDSRKPSAVLITILICLVFRVKSASDETRTRELALTRQTRYHCADVSDYNIVQIAT